MFHRDENQPPFVEDFQQQIAHIYSLLRNICTFKKVRFNVYDDWTQSKDGYFKLQMPCTDFIALAAFENIDGAHDKRANCVVDANARFVTVTSTAPFDGYIVAADINCDDDDMLNTNPTLTVDNALNKSSLNPVSNRAVTTAINSLLTQVSQLTVPESLPASDVYPWAKTKTKPRYTWDEICGKPSVVTSITLGGQELPNYNGVVLLDKINNYLKVPKRMSELMCDISYKDLTDYEDLALKLQNLDETGRANTIANSQLKNIVDKHINETQKALDDNSKEMKAVRNELGDKFIRLEADMEATHKKCEDTCANAIQNLTTSLASVKLKSEQEDEELHSELSALEHRHRLKHENYDVTIASMQKDIANLKTTSNAALVELIDTDLKKVKNDIAQVKKDTNDTLLEVNTTVSDMKVTVDNNTKDVNSAKNTASVATETANNAVEKAESAYAQAVNSANKAQSATNTANDALAIVKSNTDAIEALRQEIPSDIPNLVKKLAANGIKVEQSETNGNIVVKTPMTVDGVVQEDADGNTVYTSEELKVYRMQIPDQTDEEAYAFFDSLVTEEELSSTIQAMTTTAKVSAVINYDDNNGDQYINITESSGLIWINGERVTLNITRVEENLKAMKEKLELQAAKIAEQEAKINELETEAVTRNEKIEALEKDITEIWKFIGEADANKNKLYDEDEANLGVALTEVDEMTPEEVIELYRKA